MARFTTAGARSFRKLPDAPRTALAAKIEAPAAASHAGRVKALQGRAGLCLRAGDDRAIVEVTETEIIVVAAGHRRDIYRYETTMPVQTLKTDGETELVVLSRRDYEALLARAGDAAAEDAMTTRIVREQCTAREDGRETLLPDWLSAAILAGEHPVKAARRRAGLTQAELAARAGVAQGHVSDVESGRRALGPASLAAVAAALAADPAWLD